MGIDISPVFGGSTSFILNEVEGLTTLSSTPHFVLRLSVEGRSLRLKESLCFDLAQHPEFMEGSKGGILRLMPMDQRRLVREGPWSVMQKTHNTPKTPEEQVPFIGSKELP